MKKNYIEPQLEIRKYALNSNGVTTSTFDSNSKNDLNRDNSNGDYFE